MLRRLPSAAPDNALTDAMAIILTFVVNSGLNFVLGLLVAKFLGPEEFGRYAIAAATGSVINATMLDWLRLSAARFYSERTRNEEPAVRATLDVTLASITLGLAAILGVALIAGVDFRIPAALAAGAAGAGIFSGLFDYHCALARARFQERTYATIVVVKNVMAFLLMAGGAFLFHNAAVVLAGLCVSVLAALVVTHRALKDPGNAFNLARRRLALTYMGYGLPLVAAVTVYTLLPLMNRTAVAASFGFAEAGYFSLAADLGIRVFAAAGSALDILLFQIAIRADELHGRDEAERQIARNGTIVLAVLLPTAAGYWLILPALESLFVPAAYHGSFSAYTTMLIPGLFAFAIIQFAMNPVFQLAKRTAPVLAAAIAGLVTNAALLLVLPARFGPHGFALSQTGGMLAALLVAFTLASRAARFTPAVRDVLVIVCATAVMTGALATLREARPDYLTLPAIAAMGALIYMAVIASFNVGGLRDTVRARLLQRRAHGALELESVGDINHAQPRRDVPRDAGRIARSVPEVR